MLEKMTYENHLGEKLEFGTFPLFVNYNDLRDFAWEITSKNDKIAAFKKGIVQKALPVIIKCKTEAEGYEVRNRVFEVVEKDVLAQQHGKIIIGDYYLKCYITGSKKTEYLIQKGFMLVEMTVHTDYPSWIKEKTTYFNKDSEAEYEFLDYPHGYMFDYMNVQTNGMVWNDSFVPVNFRMVIHGAIINPSIFINGHRYNVDVELLEDEDLIIDSVEKTIVKMNRMTKETVNCFSKRNRDFYVFQKIPVGNSIFISPNEVISFDLTLLDERSEPKWI